MKTLCRIFLGFFLIASPLLVRAEDKPTAPQHFYHLLFRLQEVDENGQIKNVRSYTTSILTEDKHSASIRTGTRIPVGDQAQFQYLDIGVDIDVRDAIEDAGKLNLSVVSNASSLAGSAVAPRAPIVRQNKWDSKVSVPIGKPTVIFSSDNLEDKGKIQLELTATPEK